jgi:hypothetical protein
VKEVYIMASVARKDGYKQAAQARRLLANVSVAPHVILCTLLLAGIEQEVSYRIATESFQVGDIQINRRDGYWLVASKFAGRYYVVVKQNGSYLSSSKDERAAVQHSVKVIEYRTAPVATYIEVATGVMHNVSKTVDGYIIDEVA